MKRGVISRLVLEVTFAGILGLTGCAAYDSLIGHPLHVLREQHQYNEQQREARKLGERMYEDTHPPAEPRRDPNTSAEMDGESPAITKRLEWDYAGPGPVWFEVWHSTNGLEDFSWSGGTNVPRHFSWLAKVDGTNGVTTFDYPLGDLQSRGPAQEFFIVRTANEFGFSDWGR